LENWKIGKLENWKNLKTLYFHIIYNAWFYL
jgi:hypothetical protein